MILKKPHKLLALLLTLCMLLGLVPAAALAAEVETTSSEAALPTSPYLNLEDHFAYVVGYPDGTVRPEGNITRAEVATIFFRMLTDEAREEYWSQTNAYNDVASSDWYNIAVSTLSNLGILGGYPDGGFHPNANITRAEFATIAVRFFEETDKLQTEDAFNDTTGHWAKESINLAYALGIVGGYPDGGFHPNANITRAEAMTIVNNTLRRSPSVEGIAPVGEDMTTWSDNMDPNKWYYAAVQEATNSHEYTYMENLNGEQWTAILPAPDWAALEKEWANANAGETADEPETNQGNSTPTVTPNPLPDDPTDVTVLADSKTGTSVDFGTVPVETLTVEPVETVAALAGETYVAYDITSYNADGTKYTGSAQVTIPLNAALKASTNLTGFVVESDGSITYIPGTRAGDNYTFTTPHFSTVGVTENTDGSKSIAMSVGDTATDTITGSYSSPTTGTDTDGKTIVTLAFNSTTIPTFSTSSATSLSNSTVYVFSDGNNYLVLNSDGTLGNTTKVAEATQWTATSHPDSSYSSYYFSLSATAGGTTSYLYRNTSGTLVTTTVISTDDGQKYYWTYYSGVCTYDANSSTSNTYYYMRYNSDSGQWEITTTSTESGVGKPYTVTTTTTAATEITFTPVAAGTTTVEVGTTTYNITVINAAKYTENVTLKVGESRTYTDTSGNYAGSSLAGLNTSIAIVDATGAAATGGYAAVPVNTVMAGQSYVIGTGNNYLTASIDDSGNVTVKNETSLANATQWKATSTGYTGYFYLSCDFNGTPYYLYCINGKLEVYSDDQFDEQFIKGDKTYDYATDNCQWTFKSGAFYTYVGTDSYSYQYPYYDNNTWTFQTVADKALVTTGNTAQAYIKVATSSNGATVIVITGHKVGTTSVVVGDTLYKITVEASKTIDVTLYIDDSASYIDVTGAYEGEEIGGNLDTEIATVAVANKKTEASTIYSIDDVTFLISDGAGNYMALNNDNSKLANTLTIADAVKWTAEPAGEGFEGYYDICCTVTADGGTATAYYLCLDDGGALKLLPYSDYYADDSEATPWYYQTSSGTFCTYDAEYNWYYLHFTGDAWHTTTDNTSASLGVSCVENQNILTLGAIETLPTSTGSVTGLISDGTNYLKMEGTTGVSNVTGIDQATVWTVTFVGTDTTYSIPYYYISNGSNYLSFNTSTKTLTVSTTATNWYLGSTSGFAALGSESTATWYYLNCSNGAWIMSNPQPSSGYGNLYSFSASGSGGAYSAITITGKAAGTTTAIVGSTQYNIRVVDPVSVKYFSVTLFDYDKDAFNNAVHQYELEQAVASGSNLTQWNGIYFGGFDSTSKDSYTGTVNDVEYTYDLGYAKYNYWTGDYDATKNGNRIYSGMAQSTLDANKNIQFNYSDAGLFNDTDLSAFDTKNDNGEVTAKAKSIYTNVEIPFVYNAQMGYYTFDANEFGAYFHEDAGQGTSAIPASNSKLYYSTTPQSHDFSGQDGRSRGWFPFDDTTSVKTSDADYYFGMSATVPFSMTSDGNVTPGDPTSGPIKFEFSGDDDVWVFIDGQLVLDIGGDRNGMNATLDFAANTWTITEMQEKITTKDANGEDVNGSVSATDVNGTAMNGHIFNDGKVTDYRINQARETFANNASHELTVFYLERGGGSSNCKIYFNLPIQDTVSVHKIVDKTDLTEQELAMVAGLNFNFTLYKDGDPVANRTFSVLNANGQVIGISATDPSGGFILQDGQTAKFTGTMDEMSGSTYYVVETPTNGFIAPQYDYTIDTFKAYALSEGSVAGDHSSKSVFVVGTNSSVDSITFTCTNKLDTVGLSNPGASPYPDWIVVDYGLPVIINPLLNDLWRGDSIIVTAVGTPVYADTVAIAEEEEDTTTSTLTGVNQNGTPAYGTVVLNADGTVTYTPTKQLSGIDVLAYEVEVTRNANAEQGVLADTAKAYGLIYIIPATSMYYEEDFGDASTPLVQFSSGWSAETYGTKNACQETGYVRATNTSPYGSDPAYLDDSGDSNGTSMYVDTKNGAAAFRYSFTGTGTSFFARTSGNTATIRINVTDAEGKLVAYLNQDTKYVSTDSEMAGVTLYNIPLYTIDNLEYGTYTVVVTVLKAVKELQSGSEFWLDGIRVINPLNPADENYRIAQTSYAADGEANMTVATLRNKLLKDSAENFTFDVPAYVKYVVGEDGKYVPDPTVTVTLKTDEDGNPIIVTVTGETNENGESTTETKYLVTTDLNVVQIFDENNTILTDENDVPLYLEAKDENDTPILDAQGNQVYMQTDSDGKTYYGQIYQSQSTDSIAVYVRITELRWTGDGFILFTDSNGAIVTAEEYKSNGPKEEVYLNNGQSVTFSLKNWDAEVNKIYLGIKSPLGLGVVNINGHPLILKNAADCYYDISEYASIAETNGVKTATFEITALSLEDANKVLSEAELETTLTSNLISVTNIKVTGGNTQFTIVTTNNVGGNSSAE